MLDKENVTSNHGVPLNGLGQDEVRLNDDPRLDVFPPGVDQHFIPKREVFEKSGASVETSMWPLPAVIHKPDCKDARALFIFPRGGGSVPNRVYVLDDLQLCRKWAVFRNERQRIRIKVKGRATIVGASS